MDKLRILLLAIVIGVNSFNSHADTIQFDANESPPYWSETAEFNGMCGEILHELSQSIGLQAKIDFQPLQRLIENDSNNDLGDPAFYVKNQDFSAIIPIAIFQNSFHYYLPNHQQTLQVERWEDLKGLRVGALKGALGQEEFFTELGIYFEESYTQESLIKKLRLGRLDVVIEIDLVAKQIIRKLFPDDEDNFYLIPISDSTSPIAIMIDVNYPNVSRLAGQYRTGLASMIKNGSYQKVIEKYYGQGQIPDSWFINMDKYQRLYRFIEVE